MKVHMVDIAELKPADYNPRTIAAATIERLKKGIKQYGLVEPLVVNSNPERLNIVIGGHQRLRAAQELGMTQVPVVFVEQDEAHEKALNLALNKLSGDWEYGKLTTLLGELEQTAGFDIEFTGFDPFEATELTDLADFSGHCEAAADGKTFLDAAADAATAEKHYVIQYTIIFDNEEQQAAWHEHIKRLAGAHPDCDTIAARLIRDIEGR